VAVLAALGADLARGEGDGGLLVGVGLVGLVVGEGVGTQHKVPLLPRRRVALALLDQPALLDRRIATTTNRILLCR
jgi:hypothetical protein